MNLQSNSTLKNNNIKKWILIIIILTVFLTLLFTKSYDGLSVIMTISLLSLIIYSVYSYRKRSIPNPNRKKVFTILGSIFGLFLFGVFLTEDPRVQLQEEFDLQLKDAIQQTKKDEKESYDLKIKEISQENEKLKSQVSDINQKYKTIEDEKKKLEEKVAQLEKEKSDLLAQNEKLKSAPVATNTPAKSNNASSGGGSSGGSSNTTPAPKPQNNVYYKNCSEVRAAGKAPIYRGQPGYAKHLDRDGDGIACE